MKKSKPWSLITVQACAKPVSPVTTLPAPFFPPSWDVPNTRESWLVWTKKMPTSETKPNPNVVYLPLSTQLNTVLSPTGTIWKKFGTTPSTMNFVLHQKNTQYFLLRLHLTQRQIVNA